MKFRPVCVDGYVARGTNKADEGEFLSIHTLGTLILPNARSEGTNPSVSSCNLTRPPIKEDIPRAWLYSINITVGRHHSTRKRYGYTILLYIDEISYMY